MFLIMNHIEVLLCCCVVAKCCVTLATARTVACQAPLYMGFSSQEY